MMGTATVFHSPKEAAIDLGLPLLGSLPVPGDEGGPVGPSFPEDEEARREYHRAASRLLLSPGVSAGPIGMLGDLPAPHRARVAATVGAALASVKTTILVDADLRGAHLSFDEAGLAQEGLVDVLRYGVRSPRVIAPTRVPGLSLLPVGSGTVDFAGTYGSEASGALFAELQRTGDLVLVNGPDRRDLDTAEPFVRRIGGWILVHELGTSDAAITRALLDSLGQESCLGVLVVGRGEGGVPEDVPELPVAAPEPGTPPPESPPVPPEFPTPPSESSPAPVPGESAGLELPEGEGALPSLPAEELPGEEPGTRARAKRWGALRVLLWLYIPVVAIAAAVWFWPGGGGEEEVGLGPVPAPSRPGLPDLTEPGGAGGATLRLPPEENVSPEAVSPAAEAAIAEGTAREDEDSPPAEAGLAEGLAPAARESAPSAVPESPLAGKATLRESPPPPVSSPPSAASPKVDRAAPLGSAGPLYGVHVSSLRTETRAGREVARLRKAGYPTLRREVDIPGKGHWIRVYVGPYGELETARSVARELRETGLESYTQIRRLPADELREETGREDR